MIEYKELSALPFDRFVKVKRPKIKSWCNNEFSAYSAELHTTGSGIETLCISVYRADRNSSANDALSIKERFFINSLGDVGGELFNGIEFFKSDCSIGTSDTYDSLEKQYTTGDLIGERIGANWVSLHDADKVILDFANRHEVFNAAKLKTKRKYSRGICWAAFYQQYVREQKAKIADENRKLRAADRMSVFDEVPQEFLDWVFDDLLGVMPWFYRYDRKKQQKGFCANCKKEGVLEKVKNDTVRICPICGKAVKLVNVNRFGGYSHIVLDCATTAIYTERHGNEFVSRFFYFEKKFVYDDPSTSKKIKKCSVSENKVYHEYRRTFWHVSSGMIVEKEHYFYNSWAKTWNRIPPKRANLDDKYLGPIYPGNIAEIIQSTGLQRLKNVDLKALCLINKNRTPAQVLNAVMSYPAVESMAKMGLNNIARRFLNVAYYDQDLEPELEGSPAKLLGIGKDVLAELAKIDATYQQAAFWKKHKLKLSDMEDFKTLIARYKSRISDIDDIMGIYGISLHSVLNYIEKQKTPKRPVRDVLMYWKDYLRTAKLLEMDISVYNVKYPKDIKKEHDRCSELFTVRQNDRVENMLEDRGRLLDELAFSDEDFLIEPLHTSTDFARESTALNHCVKTYIKRCANGETNIFGLRRVECPDTPYFTVNIDNNGELIQNRGKNNCDPPKEVKSFVNKWLKFVEKKLKTVSLDPKAVLNKIQVRIGA